MRTPSREPGEKKKSVQPSSATPPTSAVADDRGELADGALFPIVGVGASAGGLEAFTQLLGALPRHTGMAFVLVQHLNPDHQSALTEILSRATSLPVSQITDDELVRVDHVYVIPPNATLTIVQGVLKIQRASQTGAPQRSIDIFFESLAQDQRERAIGVVLSGTANDGTMGLEAIKAEGGITFAQDDSAQQDSMPRSAVAAGCVDLILSPAAIAKELVRIASHPYSVGQSLRRSTTKPAHVQQSDAEADDASEEGMEAADAQGDYKKIISLLRAHSGVDFALYKPTTIQRRVARRLVVTKQNTLHDYADFLRGNPGELDALYSDVLISVTSFFRNPETFDVLQHEILPALFKERGDDPLRIWVAGCSTGQEAYSIAMAFVEAAEKAQRSCKLQVFATDLNEAVLDKARLGLYAKSLVADIAPARLKRFFVEADGGYRIDKMLRDMVVFARQNLTADPPFSRVDLISCRNTLIYLEPSAQKKAMPTFHYALKPGGFLVLGASESIGGFTNLFEPVDRKHKIYSKKPALNQALNLPVRTEQGEGSPVGRTHVAKRRPGAQELPENLSGELNPQREADRISVSQFAPPGVLVNAELQVLQFRGETGAFLEPPTGKPSFDVLKMARNGLMLPLRSAINEAKLENKTTRRDNVRLERDGNSYTVNLEVIPLKNLRELCFLILFNQAQGPRLGNELVEQRKVGVERSLSGEKKSRITELETELSETREYLQSLQEQLETASEEFQASNEEVQSANEELQSSNEELETSKEELESTNEELTTVNEEMSNRNVELNRLNSDLVNLQASAKVAIVLLGPNLNIRRFDLYAEKQFDLIAADIGRPIGHVRHNLVLGGAPESALDLESLCAEVVSNVREQECEVRDKGGRWYSLRVRPYRTLDNQVDGAVVVVVDIDTFKRSEQAVRESEARYRVMFESTNMGVCETDAETSRLLRANEQFAHVIGYPSLELVGKTLLELTHPDDLPLNSEASRSRLIRGEIPSYATETRLVRKDGTNVWVHLAVSVIRDAASRPLHMVVMALDITERKRAEKSLRETHAQLGLHAEELIRFNRVAIGRELRMIELKKDLDEVCRQHGEPARHPFELVHEAGIQEVGSAEPNLKTEGFRDGAVPLDSIVCTDELDRRPSRLPDFETENRMLGAMTQALAESPSTILQTLAESIREVFKADSAGVSLLSKDGKRFYWPAIAGVWKPHIGGSTPRNFGPCGDVLDRNAPLLFRHFERRYAYLSSATPPAEECLLVPFYVQGKAVGTIWAIAHDDRRKFDAEDLRQLVSLARFASAAYQTVELKDAQDLRLAALNLLEDAVQSRQAMEKLNVALRENEAKLSAADSRKNEFLAMLGHELRNPLSALTHSLDLLGKMPHGDPERFEELHRMMGRQSKRMANLLDQLLDITRVVTGKVELSKGCVDLADVVRAAVETIRPLMESQRHKLVLSLPPDRSVLVLGDAARLGQVVENLLTNAAKYTDEGGQIALTLEAENDQARIIIRDTGIGMSAELLPHIFEVFTQASRTLERAKGGMGLGLPLVRRLVEMHGGEANASSPGPDHGSEFIVTLPRMLERRGSERVAAPVRKPGRGLPCRIMVVDDEVDTAEMFAEILQHDGHQALAVHDGPAALAAIHTFAPDVVLLDLGLPKMDGYEVARRIRGEHGDKTILLIAVTGYQKDMARLKDAGFDQHLVKPPDLQKLSSLLEAWASRTTSP